MKKHNSVVARLLVVIQGIPHGKGCSFFGVPVILKTGGGEIIMGDRVTIISRFLDNLIGLYQRSIIFARDGAQISIGNNVGMSGTTIYSFNSIEIGDNTLIGANTKIIDSDFHPVNAVDRLENCDNKNKTQSKPIKIGSNVFIGCNCIILKGSIIGDNCVVGAGSVVCGHFESNTIIAGNPARVIKETGGSKWI